MTDSTAILVGASRRMTTGLKELYHWVQTLKSFEDANVKRVADSMERIIEKAL